MSSPRLPQRTPTRRLLRVPFFCRSRVALAIVAALGTTGASQAYAQEANASSPASAVTATSVAGNTLDSVVVTGSRVEMRTFDLPYSVDAVGREQITNGQLKVNASEALAAVPGIVVQNRQNYAQDLQISSRGFGARAAFGVRGIKLVADGIPASTPDGQGQAATFNLDLADRIEVLRGPFSTIYGNAAGGVIQLFTRDPEGPFALTGGLMAGSYGTWKADLEAEGTSGSMGYLLDASRFHTDGYRQHSEATRDQSYAKLNLRPDDASKLVITAGSLHQAGTQDPLGLTWAEYQADPRSVDPVAISFNTRKSIEQAQTGANYERSFGPDKLQLVAYLGQRSVTQYQAIPPGPQANPRHAGGVVDFDRDFHGLSARWIMNRDALGGSLQLIGGLDWDWASDDRRGYQNFIGSTLGVQGTLRRDEIDEVHSLDPYVQAEWQRDAWTVTAGVRHNHVAFDVTDHYLSNGDDSGSLSFQRTTGALALGYKFTPNLNGYVGVATGFETPALSELSYATPTTGFNFGLKPARNVQTEAGLKARLGEATRVNAALFEVRTEDEIVVSASSGGRTSYQNAGRTLRQGLEIAIDTRLAATLTARGSLTVLHAIYDEAFVSSGRTIAAGSRMPAIPVTTFYGELAWQALPPLATALEAMHRSAVYVEDSNSATPAPDYTVFNLRMTSDQTHGAWKFTEMLRIDNLADHKYVGSVIVGDSNGRYYEPGTGRAAYAGVQARYQF